VISHIILPQHRLILTRASGPVTLKDLLDLFDQVNRDPLYDRDFDGLTDIRDQRTTLTPKEMKQYVERISVDPMRSRGRWAFLASEPTDTALSYFYGQLLDGGSSTSVFATLDAALQWLRPGAEQDYIEERLDDLAG
jgi:hypothetical protein